MKKLFTLLTLFSLCLTSCNDDDDDLIAIDSDIKWWVLVHPTNGNEGIYLYNETTSSIEKKIDLPNGFSSPHALDYDGKSLWIGGFQDSASILELSPVDGSILSEIENIRTEGIACFDDYIYYSGSTNIYKIDKQGVPIETISTQSNVIQDIAINQSTLYYVYNGVIDPIIKISSTDSTEGTLVETEVTGLYTLAIYNDNLIIITDSNEIRRFDINSGQKISDTTTIIEGWITAIAPYKK